MDSNFRAEIAVTRNSPGWQLILQIGEKLVSAKTQEALDEEDDAKGATLRRDARARRDFLRQLKFLVDATVNGDFDPTVSPEEAEAYEVAI